MLKSVLTRIAKGSLIYGIGGMLQRFMELLLLPFFTRVLNPEDYGVVALVSLVGVAMSGLLTLGTGNSMSFLYYREEDLTKRPTIIWSNIVLIIGNGMFWYAIIFLLAPLLSYWMFQTDRYADLIRLAMFGNVLSEIANPWLTYLRMEERAKHYVVLMITSSILTIMLSIWLVLILRIGVLGLILARMLAHGVMLVVNWWSVGRKLHFRIDKDLFKPLVRIGFPSIFGLFAFLLIDYADRQMIKWMLDLTDLGIYSIGYSFGMLMNIAAGAFATAWPPFFMSYFHKREEAKQIFASVLTYYVIGFGGLIVLFFFVAKPVVLLMTAPAFHEAHLVVGLVAAGYALKGCYLIVLPGVHFAGKLHRQSMIEWVVALINIGLNLWLIPIYGIVGAAIATFVSYLVLTVLAWFVSRQYLEVNYQWKRLATSSIVIAFSAALLYQASILLDYSLLQTMIVNSIIFLMFLSTALGFLLTTNERSQIWNMLK